VTVCGAQRSAEDARTVPLNRTVRVRRFSAWRERQACLPASASRSTCGRRNCRSASGMTSLRQTACIVGLADDIHPRRRRRTAAQNGATARVAGYSRHRCSTASLGPRYARGQPAVLRNCIAPSDLAAVREHVCCVSYLAAQVAAASSQSGTSDERCIASLPSNAMAAICEAGGTTVSVAACGMSRQKSSAAATAQS
jgi:hypothetical protein